MKYRPISLSRAGRTAKAYGTDRGTPARGLCRIPGQSSASGQELVEFAIVFLVLIFFVFGVFDLGRLFHVAIVIENAAREGARYGITSFDTDTNTIDSTGIGDYARKEAALSGVDLTDPEITSIGISCPLDCGRGLPVRVVVTYNFKFILSWVLPISEMNLTRGAEMMVPR